MRIPEEKKSASHENILPLVNVVFLLLIFFMLSGAFSKPDLYKIDELVSQSESPADRKILTVQMNADGLLAIEKRELSKEELTSLIKEKVKDDKKLKVQLKADSNVPAVELLDLMDMLGETGLENIHLLTLAPDAKKS